MNRKAHYLVLALTILFSVVMLAGCQEGKQNQAIGKVNGETITQKQFDQHYQMVLGFYQQNYGDIDKDKEQELFADLKNISFDDLVDKELIWQESAKRGLEADQEQVEQDLKSMRKHRDQQEKNGYQKFLEKNGFDEEFLKLEFVTQNLYWQLRNEITGDITVTDEECQDYYEKNNKSFAHPAGKEIYHILVETREEADKVLEQLKQGRSFSQLAAQYSVDPGNKSRGGDLGLVNEDTNFVEPFKKAALEVPVGELLSTPVETEFGFHIIKAGQQLEEGIWPFDRVQADIKAFLLQDKQNQVFNQFLEDLRANAEIEDFRKS